MRDIECILPWRPELDFVSRNIQFSNEAVYLPPSLKVEASNFADIVLIHNLIPGASHADLVIGLERAAAYYLLGKAIDEEIKSNTAYGAFLRKKDNSEVADLLKIPGRGRPKGLAEQGLIWVMTTVWEFFESRAGRPGTAYYSGSNPDRRQGDIESRFQTVCNAWIKTIDPNRSGVPKRKTYRRIQKAWI